MTPQTLVFMINIGNWHIAIRIYLETSSGWTLSVIIVLEPIDWRLLGHHRFYSCSLHQMWFLIKTEGEEVQQACCQLLHLNGTTKRALDYYQTSCLCGFIYLIVSKEENTVVISNTCSTKFRELRRVQVLHDKSLILNRFMSVMQ